MDEIDTWVNKVYQANGDQKKLNGVYDNWANTYDQHLWAMGNPFVAVAATMLSRQLPNLQASILDAGCGTGNLGHVLYLAGYTCLSGLDPSQGMLAVANKKSIYNKLYELPLGVRHILPSRQFDAVVSTGVLTTGHASPNAIDDMLDLTKTNGFLVFSVSDYALKSLGFSEKIFDLTKQSRWKNIERSKHFNSHPFDKSAVNAKLQIFTYQKLT